MFKGFKPQGLQKIATRMGYAGDMEKFDDYLKQNPDKEREMIVYRSKAQQMARGGSVRRFAEGGDNVTIQPMPPVVTPPPTLPDVSENMDNYNLAPGEMGGLGGNVTPEPIAPVPTAVANPLPQQPTPVADYTKQVGQVDAEGNPVLDADGNQVFNTQGMDITEVAAQRMSAPALPSGGAVVGQGITQEEGQYIPTSSGQVSGAVAVPTTLATTTQAQLPADMVANTMTADTTKTDVNSALDSVDAATSTLDPKSKVIAAEQTKSAVSDLKAAQGTATELENPVQRQIEEGELISGAADAEKAAKFTEQVEAATATPTEKATVQGQLKTLTEGFDANNPPPWAAATLRAVQSQMAARGMGASSMAGQAMIQGALESALPIAQADAATQAQFESQNLSNRQARAMLAAQQRATFLGQEFDQDFQARVQNSARVADIANQNFTAEQSIALENSRVANTMNLQNLSNSQALVMAEASALANLDTANLNNRQQAAVQNAQAFLQTDMANLANEQQTILFKAQQRTQSLFTDTAAENAAKQFNASSQNQTDQFFANLSSQTAQFNATQSNAQSQYNAGQRNVLERFNAELNNQRDTFNAQNRLVIDQNNATWRRQVATADTATVNRVNEINATNLLATSTQAYNNLWNYYGDTMEWAWKSAESELERMNNLALAELSADTQNTASAAQRSSASGNALGSLVATLGAAFITRCWVAREVYGSDDYTWIVFRNWMFNKAPKWLDKLYIKHGEQFAKYISNKPMLKKAVKFAMDSVVKNHKMEYKRANN